MAPPGGQSTQTRRAAVTRRRRFPLLLQERLHWRHLRDDRGTVRGGNVRKWRHVCRGRASGGGAVRMRDRIYGGAVRAGGERVREQSVRQHVVLSRPGGRVRVSVSARLQRRPL